MGGSKRVFVSVTMVRATFMIPFLFGPVNLLGILCIIIIYSMGVKRFFKIFFNPPGTERKICVKQRHPMTIRFSGWFTVGYGTGNRNGQTAKHPVSEKVCLFFIQRACMITLIQ